MSVGFNLPIYMCALEMSKIILTSIFDVLRNKNWYDDVFSILINIEKTNFLTYGT